MRSRTLAAAATGLLIVAGNVEAATENGFTSLWVFGDSLSDPGNLFELTGGASPQSPPYARRFSDGPVWAEHVAEDFARKGLPSGNFAHGGATASTSAAPVPDLDRQIDLFRAGSAVELGTRPVAAVWIGANDFFRQVETDPTPAAVGARMQEAAAAVSRGVADLAQAGVPNVMVFNLPPLDLTPAFAAPGAAALAAFGTRMFNDSLAAELDALDGTGIAIARFDIEMAMQELIADPASFGLTNTTVPCYVPGLPPETRCSPEMAALSFFFDPVHPTQIVHAEIAERVREQIAPIPLPAPVLLLLAGLAALAAMGRRRV